MGKKSNLFLLVFFCFILVGFYLYPRPVFGLPIAGSSAAINSSINDMEKANQNKITKIYRIKRTIQMVLEKHQSPLANESQTFVDVCLAYDLDCYLLPAISGLESSFGLFVYPNSYNPFGWGGGYITFSSWSQAIEVVGYNLRKNYLDKGAKNIYEIGQIYAESPTWANRVINLINLFYREENNNRLYFAENKVEL